MLSKFVSDDELRSILMALDNIVDEIRRTEFDYQCLDESVHQAEADAYEAVVFLEVSAAVDAKTGKPLYTNKDQRDAAVKSRLSNDAEYKTIMARVNEVINEKRSKGADLYRKRDQFKALCSKATLLASIIQCEAQSNNPKDSMQGVRQ